MAKEEGNYLKSQWSKEKTISIGITLIHNNLQQWVWATLPIKARIHNFLTLLWKIIKKTWAKPLHVHMGKTGKLKDTQRSWRTMIFLGVLDLNKNYSRSIKAKVFQWSQTGYRKFEPHSLDFIFCPFIWTLPEANPGLFCIAQGQDSFFSCCCRLSEMLTWNLSSTAAWNKHERSRWKIRSSSINTFWVDQKLESSCHFADLSSAHDIINHRVKGKILWKGQENRLLMELWQVDTMAFLLSSLFFFILRLYFI